MRKVYLKRCAIKIFVDYAKGYLLLSNSIGLKQNWINFQKSQGLVEKWKTDFPRSIEENGKFILKNRWIECYFLYDVHSLVVCARLKRFACWPAPDWSVSVVVVWCAKKADWKHMFLIMSLSRKNSGVFGSVFFGSLRSLSFSLGFFAEFVL